MALFAMLTMMGLFGYLINDWFDRSEDFAVGKRNAFHASHPRVAGSLFGLLLLGLIGIGTQCDLSPLCWTLLGGQTLCSLAYSAHPLRLKARGVLGLICVLLAQYLLPMLFMLAAVGEIHPFLWCLLTGFIGFNGLLLETGHQVWDVRNDVQTGLKTAIRVLGPHRVSQFYQKMLPALGLGILILPVALIVSLWQQGAELRLILSALPVVVMVVPLGATTLHLYRSEPGVFDPYYNSQSNGMDRLYSYFPTAAIPMYWLAIIVPQATQDWRFLALAPLWVFFALPQQSLRFHWREWRYMFVPPELMGRFWRGA